MEIEIKKELTLSLASIRLCVVEELKRQGITVEPQDLEAVYSDDYDSRELVCFRTTKWLELH